MLRKYLIQKYIDVQEIEEILWHNSAVYIRWILTYLFLLFLVYVGYCVWHQSETAVVYAKWIAWLVWLWLFFWWFLSFLNLYLDCLLFTKTSIMVFLRDGILKYRTEIFDRGRITVISYHQNSFFDKLFNKGDIIIQLGTVNFTFTDVHSPKKCVSKILMLKKQYEEMQSIKIEQDLQGDQRNFDHLVEALWGVIREYMEHKEPLSS